VVTGTSTQQTDDLLFDTNPSYDTVNVTKTKSSVMLSNQTPLYETVS